MFCFGSEAVQGIFVQHVVSFIIFSNEPITEITGDLKSEKKLTYILHFLYDKSHFATIIKSLEQFFD